MISSRWVLGAIVAAAVGFAVSMPSWAHAEEQGYFEAAHYPSHLAGLDLEGETNAFTTAEIVIECDDSSYTGTLTKKETTATITPTYQECAAGEDSATITTNGCTYRLHIGKGTEGEFDGTADLVCPAGKQVEMHIYNGANHASTWCTVNVPAQNGLEGVSYAADPETASVIVDGAFEGIAGSVQGECTLGFTVPFEDGSYDVGAGIVASPVEAQGYFTAKEYPAHVSETAAGGPSNSFTVGTLTVECADAGYTGKINGKTSTLSLSAAYAGCSAGERPATVTTNGCTFLFELAKGFTDQFDGTVDLVCPGANQVEIHVYNGETHSSSWCTARLPAQTDIGGVSYGLETASHSAEIGGAAEGLKGTVQGQCTTGFDVEFETGAVHLDATVSTVPDNKQGTFEETSEDYPVHVYGQDTPAPALASFTMLGSETKCGMVTYTAALASPNTTIDVVPTYKECTRGTRSATLNMRDCFYRFHVGLGAGHDWSATTDLVCPGGVGPQLLVYNDAAHTQLHCTTNIKPKNGFTGATFTNETTTPDAIHIHGAVEGVEGTSQGACTFGFPISFTTGVFHLNATVEGTEGKDLAVAPHPES